MSGTTVSDMIPISPQSALFQEKISLIATDMDGTLTQQGLFTSSLLAALEALAKAEIPVLIVTGRSAGWVQGIKSYLPIVGAIAENGGIFFASNSDDPEILTGITDLKLHRQQLTQIFDNLKTEFPQIAETADNHFRLTDWTFDVQGLTPLELQQMQQLCTEKGWGFTYSNVQCHIKPLHQDKATSLLQVIKTYYPHLNTKQIITVGDSPNDESLFDPAIFPLSVGVANVLHYSSKLSYLPTYVTASAEGKGFYELAELLINRVG